MEYTHTPTEDLIPYVNNSRTHSDEQVLQIASSIKEFGFLNPIIIDQDNGIIAGHGRVMAAKKLGLEHVPTLLVDHLSEAQKKAYVIADNQLALNSGWDFDLLKVEIEALKESDFDVDLVGFEDFFLQSLEQEKDIDLDALQELENEKDPLEENLMKAIQIEFPMEIYEEAKEIIKEIRDGGSVVGEVVLNALKSWR